MVTFLTVGIQRNDQFSETVPMKVLMFGWEFPPHISGGLGTACYGLTRELARIEGVEVTFVVPKVWGDEALPDITLLNAGQVPVVHQQLQFDDLKSKFEYYELQSGLVPYLGTAEFDELKSASTAAGKRFVEVTPEGKIVFEGGYQRNLFQEINYYAVVAEQLAREIDFDVIHVHDWMCFPAGIAVKQITGKSLVVHVHSTEFDRSGSTVNTAICAIEKEGMLAADQVIAVSDFTRRTIVRNYAISPGKIKTIHNAVEQVEYTVRKKKRGFGADKVVSFLGRITAQKGPEYFIEAASQVILQVKDVRFVMAGKGDLLDEMKRRATALNISGYFHFPGFLTDEEIAELFRMSDVFVMSSVSEPFGIVALEAMQAGVPVVVSRQSGVSEVVKNAVKVDFWDTKEMAEAICGLLTNPKFRRSLAEKGRREAGKLIWSQAAAKVHQIYLDLIEKNGFRRT